MKKTKKITITLVSALCFLLVLAIGLGLTGAWYNARREANGIFYLDKGIVLLVKNMNRTQELDSFQPSDSVTGSLNELDGSSLVNINSKNVIPGDEIKLAVPTIAAYTNNNDVTSVNFYAKAKIAYYVRLLDATNNLTGDYIALGSLYTRSGTPGEYTYTAATASSFFVSAPAFKTGWTATENDATTYYYGSVNGNDEAVLTEISTASGDIELLAGGQQETFTPGDYEYNKFVTLTVADVDAEAGGPRLYQYESGEYTEVKTGLLHIDLYIQVIQSANLAGTQAYEDFAANGIAITDAPTINLF